MKEVKITNRSRIDPRILAFMLTGVGIISLYAAIALYETGKARNSLTLFTVAAIVCIAIVEYIIGRNTQRASFISIIACAAGLVDIEVSGGITGFALVWSTILPPMAFYTLGRKGGFGISALFLAGTVTVVALKAMGMIETPHPFRLYLELLVVFSFNTAMIAVYEHAVRYHRLELVRAATHDLTTDLPNRESLKAAIARTETRTLFIVSLDDLCALAEVYGEKAQRDITLATARRLAEFAERTPDTHVFHIQSNEFALLHTRKIETERAESIASRLCSAVGKSIVTSNSELWATITVGVSIDSRRPFADCNAALKAARDTCVPWAIVGGTQKKRIFPGQYIESLSVIRKGIDEDLFVPHYQPIMDNRSGRITKYECLARLETPEGTLSPAEFMDQARLAKLYPSITRAIVRKSFSYFTHEQGDFSINLRLDDLMNRQTTSFILDRIDRYRNGHRVIFELLETDRIEEMPEVTAFIRAARERGCRFAIDDFGSGYSNFAFTIGMKADFIKIDSSLISSIAADSNARIAVIAIVSFAKALGVVTIAEFVHDGETQDWACELGIDCSQGYFIGKPIPGRDVAECPDARRADVFPDSRVDTLVTL